MASDDITFAKGMASEIGANTVYDVLNSDIKYFYPTGCKCLDIVLGGGGGGTGGVPSGRFVELFGPESTGKSTIALGVSKSFVEYWKGLGEKNLVLWLEAESVFDKRRAKYIGCDLDHFLIKEVLSIEDAFQTIHAFLDKGKAKKLHTMIVLDTIAALHPEAELQEGGKFAGGMMYKPRLLKAELSKVMPKLGETDTPMIFVNQVYAGGAYQAAQSPGGSGLRFFPSIRASVSVVDKKTAVAPSGDEIQKAIVTELVTKKNKITLPNQKCSLWIDGERGLLPLETAITFCENNLNVGAITKAGAWKTFSTRRIGENGEIEDVEIKYQKEQLPEKAKGYGIDLLEHLDYYVTAYYAKNSVFLKVSLIENLWQYEEKLFGRRETTLTPEEEEIAKLVYQRDVLESTDGE